MDKIEILVHEKYAFARGNSEKAINDAGTLICNVFGMSEQRREISYLLRDKKAICHTPDGVMYWNIDVLIDVCQTLFSELYGETTVSVYSDKIHFIASAQDTTLSVHLVSMLYEEALINFMCLLAGRLLDKKD